MLGMSAAWCGVAGMDTSAMALRGSQRAAVDSPRVLRSGGVARGLRGRGEGGHGDRGQAQAVHGQESGEDGQDEEHAGAQPEGVARLLRLLVHSGHRERPVPQR